MKKFIAAVWVVVVMVSCGDDDPKPKTTEELLQGATRGWVTTSVTISPALSFGGTSITDLFSILDACDKDDVVIFTSGTNYSIENPQKCEASEPTIWESGTWTLSADKKTIRFVPTGDSPYELQIQELTESTLRGTVVEAINGVNYTLTQTLQPRK